MLDLEGFLFGNRVTGIFLNGNYSEKRQYEREGKKSFFAAPHVGVPQPDHQ
ncbi:hypothetical protein D3C86_1455280 [compost metagenome]